MPGGLWLGNGSGGNGGGGGLGGACALASPGGVLGIACPAALSPVMGTESISELLGVGYTQSFLV